MLIGGAFNGKIKGLMTIKMKPKSFICTTQLSSE